MTLIAPVGEICRFSEMIDEQIFSYDSGVVVKALNQSVVVQLEFKPNFGIKKDSSLRSE